MDTIPTTKREVDLDSLLAKRDSLEKLSEYKKLLKKHEKLIDMEKVYPRARYARVKLFSLQRWSDRRLLSQFEDCISNYNEALIAFRQKHVVTPEPFYYHRNLNEKNETINPFGPSLREVIEEVHHNPYSDITLRTPEKTMVYFSKPTDGRSGPSMYPYCGFCGELDTTTSERPEEKRGFLYRGFAVFGLGPNIWACGKQRECLEIGLASYIRTLEIDRSLGDLVLKIAARGMGREDLTRTQAAYLQDRLVQRIVGNLKWE